MFQDNWELYETPRHPKKWIFYPRKRSALPSLFSIMAACAVIFVAVSHF